MISAGVKELAKKTEASLASVFGRIDEISEINTERVLDAFARAHVSEACFVGTTGYGYDDRGRTVLEEVYADVFGGQAALVRPHFINGTHTIACGLFGVLRAGNKLLCATGMPYDTLVPVIFGEKGGSLKEYGVTTEVCELLEPDGSYCESAHLERLGALVGRLKPSAALIQRSRGYSLRPTLSPEAIDRIAGVIKSVSPQTRIVVDNCYGEFADVREPLISREKGVDLLCGSLIKNPGGGLAPTGGYIVGTEEAVEGAACRLVAPGIGGEAGSYTGGYRLFFQGLFMAPHTVAQAIKTAVFAAAIFEAKGFGVLPRATEPRFDIIQTLSFGTPEPLLAFMRGIQAGAPVDSFVTPEPWDMPGYDDPVVMAAGAFVGGASIELSADAPMREPYTAFLQGGLTYESGKLGILKALEFMDK
ncbi:MAG: methionine gamma-lyase family protein [Clostridia bacterium]|nr:methionine gamma-lyase family protein [Clostridia bacterium]